VVEAPKNSNPTGSPKTYPVEPIIDLAVTGRWGDHATPLFAIQALNSARMRTPFDVNMWRVGPLIYIYAKSGGRILRRTLEHIALTPGFMLLTRHVSGRIIGVVDDVPYIVHEGEIILRDLDHAFDALQYPSEVQSVLIPKHISDIELRSAFAMKLFTVGSDAESSLGNILSTSFVELLAQKPVLERVWVDQLVTYLRALHMRPAPPLSRSKEIRRSQFSRIQAYMESNLGRLDLCAEELLGQFGVSRATLYRLFEQQGGVRNYIVDRRLFRALLELSIGPRRRGQIQQAAKRWGFSSAANFNRSVQQAFGSAPGALFRDIPVESSNEQSAPEPELHSTREPLSG